MGEAAVLDWSGSHWSRSSNRRAAHRRREARGVGGWTKCSPEWADDGSIFTVAVVDHELGASAIDPSWELPRGEIHQVSDDGVCSRGSRHSCSVLRQLAASAMTLGAGS
jgi:hypothetical protein